MIRELEQTIRDKESWNENRLDAPPFDVGWDKCMVDVARKELAAWERQDIPEANRLANRMQVMVENGRDSI